MTRRRSPMPPSARGRESVTCARLPPSTSCSWSTHFKSPVDSWSVAVYRPTSPPPSSTSPANAHQPDAPPAYLLLGAAQPRVERVPQPIADQVQAQHRQKDRRARRVDEP